MNSYNAPNGKVGIALALPVGEAFGAGTQEVAQVTFVVSPSVANSTGIAFGSVPVFSQTADPDANPLTTTYVNGILSVTPLPVLQLALTPGNTNVVLSWPSAATGFNLESSLGFSPGAWSVVNASMVTNTNSISVTVPVSGAQQFFRLHHP